MPTEWEQECRVYIAVAEACWRKENPSHSWHVFDWLCWKQRRKYPLIRKQDSVINSDGAVT